eukprot:6205656-Pleurochrysis_carterae.AAC.1
MFLRHGSVEYAALLKKHGFPPLRSLNSAPDDWWIFDDSSPASGRFDTPVTTLAAARSNPYEVGGQIDQPDLTQGEPNAFLVNQMLEARRQKGK